MLEPSSQADLPAIPGKRYFTIGEVSELCGVKPHVLRYWEQEFPQLKPLKRRGNRRYYQRQDVILIRLSGEEAKVDVNQSQQIIRQLRVDLEDVLLILKR